jgi:hypothetical protein
MSAFMVVFNVILVLLARIGADSVGFCSDKSGKAVGFGCELKVSNNGA